MPKMSLTDLRRILVENAGEVEGTQLDESLLDVGFEEIGYDSLALMESAAAITDEYGVEVPDETLADLRTPRQFLEFVNSAPVVS
ncbi:acyl carrier protein [Nocardiopsis halotolerans]|uniref:acyl carrier protein n=1 Tax=Nocardiopsis halotolerans TaxID=124252 RepID=UPI0003470310|nr:acyl carrier protein [Nocardiopsis halotolerans]